MNRWRVPGDVSEFLAWKDNPDDVDLMGAPGVWDVPYQLGAMAFGRLGPVDLRVAAMNSAPSSHPGAWKTFDGFERPSWVFGVRWKAAPSVEIGVSYDRGPWMAQPTARTARLTIGTSTPAWRDFDQELISADVGFARGPVMIRAEVMHDRWEVANVEDTPTELTGSIEVQADLAAGLFAAARGGFIDSLSLDDPLGSGSPDGNGREDWDYDVYRYEASLGYRVTRRAGLLLSGYRQIQTVRCDGDTTFVGLRVWWGF